MLRLGGQALVSTTSSSMPHLKIVGSLLSLMRLAGVSPPLIPGIALGAHVDQVCHRFLSQARLLTFLGDATAYDLVELDLAARVRVIWTGRFFWDTCRVNQ